MRAHLENAILSASPASLPRCGPAAVLALRRLTIETVGDLVHHFPARYEDHSVISDISTLQENVFATVRGRVQQLRGRHAFRRGRMHVVEGLVGDDTGSVRVVWFQQPYITKNLAVGDEIFLTGKVSRDVFGFQFKSPSYEKTSADETLHTARVVPIYGLTEGISQKQFRTLVKAALDKIKDLEDWVPTAVLSTWQLPSFAVAMHDIHFPEDLHVAHAAQQRFQFDHALLHYLNQRVVTQYNQSVHGCPLPLDVEIVKNFIASLPFDLTDDQKKAVFAILKDMEAKHPMNRLLQGDVGSGKTVVAAVAMRHAAAHGCTSILLAPTQILAEQHAVSLQKLFASADIPVILRTQATKKKIITPRGASVIVGTHALLHEKTQYPQLGLVVVDEQHRFGVAQRKAIKAKNKAGYVPHFLSMSATPIPRSLALVMYGSLSVSSIKQMPRGRKPIITRVVQPSARDKAVKFVQAALRRGEQAFVVAPLIDPSDMLSVESATELYEEMRTNTFKDFRVALVHGRIKQKERAEIMDAMRRGEIDVLVATAVIEVGVDIPNATVMWIEGSERFGLAQLHQFRGRVGRGDKQSYCFLFSGGHSEMAKKRLSLMEQTTDGFVLAEKDLEMRGGGEMWGVVQSGFSEIEFLREIPLDVWEMAHEGADKIMSEMMDLPLIKKQLERFEEELHRE